MITLRVGQIAVVGDAFERRFEPRARFERRTFCRAVKIDVKIDLQFANVIFDTQDVRITGRGEVRLGPEELDLSIKGEPKKSRLARLRTPESLLALLQILQHGPVATRKAAAVALASLRTPEAVAAVTRSAEQDPDARVRQICSILLGE